MVSSSVLCGQNVVDEHWVTAHCKSNGGGGGGVCIFGLPGFSLMLANQKRSESIKVSKEIKDSSN